MPGAAISLQRTGKEAAAIRRLVTLRPFLMLNGIEEKRNTLIRQLGAIAGAQYARKRDP
jgi:hypothetical protein